MDSLKCLIVLAVKLFSHCMDGWGGGGGGMVPYRPQFFFFCVHCDNCFDSIPSAVDAAYWDGRYRSSADPQSLVLRDMLEDRFCCLA